MAHNTFVLEESLHFCTNTYLAKNIFHQTPLSEAGLQQVGTGKRREPIPVVIDPGTQRQGHKHKRARDYADVSVEGHFPPPSLM